MAEVKLTKAELRIQRNRLTQLQRYLPTIRLKKAMLQLEVNQVRIEIQELQDAFHETRLNVTSASSLLSESMGVDMEQAASVTKVLKHYENIAGVDVPHFEGVEFAPFEYSLFATPPWIDSLVIDLRKMAHAKAAVFIAEEKKAALEKELREVTIRVNLFEKNLIPRSQKNIKKIKIFLGDQELAAVSQAKVAKTKIEERKAEDKKSKENHEN